VNPRTGPSLPAGNVTYLFTDVEDSTKLWERHPDEMRVALAIHDRLLRDAIEGSNGRVVKTTGDGVLAAFALAEDALAACLSVQRALQAPKAGRDSDVNEMRGSIALKVRMGMHSGAAELRDGDYFGPALNRAARIMSVAYGEQVLVSAATAELLHERMPGGVALREMGEHRLKGLPGPERLLQVLAEGLRQDFPPLASLTGHGLPAERDVFVGRREALDALARRLDDGARLVSIVGIGGTGKTRLVTRFAWAALGEFPGGAWFCDLAQSRSLDGIVHAVAQGLDIPLGNDDPIKQIGHAIAGRGRCLVILDNFEQVVQYARQTVGHWLGRAAHARFLVTTREVLSLPGEVVLDLPPLGLADAAALFERRAEAAVPGFRPTADDRTAIESLVKLLDGLPLAVELAAARVRVTPPRRLLTRMRERFKLLTSTSGRVDRQATLRAVLDWSWDLLSLPERAALAQISAFEGGFTLESVEGVVELPAGEDTPWTMDVVQSLVQKSLVRQSTDLRFDLLVSVQEYAAEHLRTEGRYPGSGPSAWLAAESRHGSFFAGLDEKAAIADGCADLDNYIVACRRAVARSDSITALLTLERAWEGLKLRGPYSVAADLAAAVRTIVGSEPVAAARVDGIAGEVLLASDQLREAHPHFSASLAAAREAGERRLEFRARLGLGRIELWAGHLEAARAQLESSLAIAHEVDDLLFESDVHTALGNLDRELGQREPARTHFGVALARARAAGDRRREGHVLGNLANSYFDEGNVEEARSRDEAALAVAREIGSKALEAISLCNLGVLHQGQGRLEEAIERFEAALALTRVLGNAGVEWLVLGNLAGVFESMGRFDRAREHLEDTLSIARHLGDRRKEGVSLTVLGQLHARQAKHDEARSYLDAGETVLRTASGPMKVSLGVLLCARAEIEHLAGVAAAAKAALAAAEAMAAETGVGSDSELEHELARVRALLDSGNAKT